MSDAFLSLLCTHCAPTLSGVKPACIFTLHKQNIPGWQTELSSCRSLFSGNGLRLRVLCGCRRHLVIMVYRPALLRESLRQPERRAFCRREAIPFQWGRDVCWMSFRGGCAVQKQAVSPTRSACSWVILGRCHRVHRSRRRGVSLFRLLEGIRRRRTGTASVSSIRRLPQTVSGYGVQRADTWRNARRRLNAPLYQF